MRNFIPQQGNLKLTGFKARTLMRSTGQVRRMVAPSPVVCQTLKHPKWTVGWQGRELPSVFEFCSTVSSWSTPTPHLDLGAALPAPALAGYSQASPGKCAGPAWQKSPLLSACSLPCTAFSYLLQQFRHKDKWRGKGIGMQVLRSERDLWSGVLCRLPRKTWLSRQKGLQGDASSDQISWRNNGSLAKC